MPVNADNSACLGPCATKKCLVFFDAGCCFGKGWRKVAGCGRGKVNEA